MPNLLIIGGSDSSGGAGVSADVGTINHLGGVCYPCITAVTAQGNDGFFKSYTIPKSILEAQLQSVKEQQIDGIKIGMLPNREAVEIVAAFINEIPCSTVILDPVLKTSSGNFLNSKDGILALKENLFPISSLITPNLDEANLLTSENCLNYEGVPELAQKFISLGSDAVLIKGGHLNTHQCKDLLLVDGAIQKSFVHERIPNGTDVRGTGCRLASAITYYIACGNSLQFSVENAIAYLSNYISQQTAL